MKPHDRDRFTMSATGDESLIAALCELSISVQRSRTTHGVLAAAGDGLFRLGMRSVVYELKGEQIVLRSLCTARSRVEALETTIGRPLIGLQAPADYHPLAGAVLAGRGSHYGRNLDLFTGFMRIATGYDPRHLDDVPSTAGVGNGLLAPLWVHDRPWGLVEILADSLSPHDAPGVSLFASHLASAIEVAQSIHALQESNLELTECYAQLARTQRELVQRERLAALGELAAVMAHEVRNPLGVLFNTIASLRRIVASANHEGQPLQGAEALLAIASEEADRLDCIVTDLLDFARPREPHFERCCLATLVKEVSAHAAEHRAAVGVVVQTELATDLPPVEVDARLLRQALLNVVMNALQAMPGRGALVLRVALDHSERQTFARVDVSDTGTGISTELKERIFEPFFTTKAFGTGLGLAVVRRIVELHHGQVAVTSAPGATTFTLRLPLAQT